MSMRSRAPRRPFRFLPPALIALPLLLGSCGGDDDGGAGPSEDNTQTFLAAVRTLDGTEAVYRTGTPPGAGGGPVVTVPAEAQVVVGGSSQVGLLGTGAFQRLVTFVDGFPGYWELTLPTAQPAITLVVTLGQALPRATFDCVYSVAPAGGEFGTRASTEVTALNVGTGDVQVSVSWDAPSDVDLHILDPAGEEIFYANRSSASGGTLDLDSNAGCAIDNVNNENITWATGTAPSGQYQVKVDYWSNCGVAQTKYTVTVRVSGRAPETFTGTFTGAGDAGGAGAGVPITTFTR